MELVMKAKSVFLYNKPEMRLAEYRWSCQMQEVLTGSNIFLAHATVQNKKSFGTGSSNKL